MTLNQLVERLKQVQEECEYKDAEIFLEFPYGAIDSGADILSVSHDYGLLDSAHQKPYIYIEIGY